MSLAPQFAARRCVQCVRSAQATPLLRFAASTAPRRRQQIACRWQSTDAAAASSASPKIAKIVEQISQLTLLETADLVSSLKSHLNIPDMPMGGFAAAAGPAAAAPAAVEEEEAAPAKEEKTLFNLKLESFDAAAKPKIIKEIKAMLGLSLVDSKKFVESAPKMMKEGVAKEEAEKIIETLKGLGGVVKME
ncbi:related to 50S ribosomal protein L12 [Ramularia collo-cygni]|uniref:Related to 50S ribosomal protein L12 n=1 Tax=Ramularia collo-cygni TaxID=112498 RepID=A0A2D3V7I2_9PEZI|nr:related to 50S ribosomal protein L12 [Ramularia collo-cygni]CZT20717.1 related to 50S ribosomal protein L12 [Ramularia collo-cygni]